MSETIGEFIHNKIKSRGWTDVQVAGFLNIPKNTLRKIYPLEDFYISRLIEFCELFKEDIIQEYYYSKEPLKKFKKAEIDKWLKEVKELKVALDAKDQIIQWLDEHVKTQNELIAIQKKVIEQLERGI